VRQITHRIHVGQEDQFHSALGLKYPRVVVRRKFVDVTDDLVTRLEGITVRDQAQSLCGIAHVCDVVGVDLEECGDSGSERRERISVVVSQQ
jgi:hypothetical protein